MHVLSFWRRPSAAAALASTLLLPIALATPADAHHPLGGETPSSVVEGFLSGLGHPVVGVDHLVFVIALGLLAALSSRGWVMPLTFVAATVAGTGGHLAEISLPVPELVIAASVLTVGTLLAQARRPSLFSIAGLGAIAGLFHGYAYGEAIVGAEMTPLVAYLAGFATVQLGIALGAFGLGRRVTHADNPSAIPQSLRFAGFTIAGTGLAFLAAATLG